MKAREVCQEIKVLTCCLHASSKTPTTVTLVEAREIDPPDGKAPLVWRLLTNRSVESAEEAIELLNWYLCRWEVEMFFDVLKVGCEVEKLQLNHRGRKSDGEPGAKSIWKGLQRLQDCLYGVHLSERIKDQL